MRKSVFAFWLISFLFISSQLWSFDVWMRTEIEGGSKPTIVGETNLPSGMRLTLSIFEKGDLKNFIEKQDNVEVSAGKFRSTFLSLKPAIYMLKISSSPTQSPNVLKIIGNNGIVLEGENVKRYSDGSTIYKVIDYKTYIDIGDITESEQLKNPLGYFRGVPFGASIKEVKSRFNPKHCSGDENWDTASCIDDFSIGEVQVGCFYEFTKDKLGVVSLTFDSSEFDYIKDVFIKKYGKPSTISYNVLTTGFGVNYKNETLTWRWKNINLKFEKYGKTVNKGSAIYISDDVIKKFGIEIEKGKEKAVKDL